MLAMFTNNKLTRFSNVLYLSSGLAIGAGFFYWFMYSPFSKPPILLDNTFKKRVDAPYENKYYDKYEQLESEDLSEDYVKGLKNSIIYEYTPKGSVLMYYDFDKSSFIYYSQTKYIPYLFLETVARKYVITNKCKSIFVDIKKELELATDSIKNNQENQDVADTTIKTSKHNTNSSDVYASFKTYNRKGSTGYTATNKKFILRQNANRYSYMGNINNYQPTKPHEYNISKPTETMDYNSYMKLIAAGKPN